MPCLINGLNDQNDTIQNCIYTKYFKTQSDLKNWAYKGNGIKWESATLERDTDIRYLFIAKRVVLTREESVSSRQRKFG